MKALAHHPHSSALAFAVFVLAPCLVQAQEAPNEEQTFDDLERAEAGDLSDSPPAPPESDDSDSLIDEKDGTVIEGPSKLEQGPKLQSSDEARRWSGGRDPYRGSRWHASGEAFITFGPNGNTLSSYGGGIRYMFLPWLSAGVNQVSFAPAQLLRGKRWSVTVAPAAEVHTFLAPQWELFGQMGVATQVRFGANLKTMLGVAPYLGGGARFWVGRTGAIGAATRLQMVSTEGFLFPTRVLPQKAVVWWMGLTGEFPL